MMILVILAVIGWVLSQPERTPEIPQEPAAGNMATSNAETETNRAHTSRRPLVVTLKDEPPDTPKPRVVVPEATIEELEARFHAAAETGARTDIVTEIAGHNDAAAVSAIARLFKTERHPAVKESLIAGLADIDIEAAPKERLAILAGALRGQPRNVRTTAIDLLGRSDDPQEIALLAKAAAEDSDKELRETAREILKAGEAERETLRVGSGK